MQSLFIFWGFQTAHWLHSLTVMKSVSHFSSLKCFQSCVETWTSFAQIIHTATSLSSSETAVSCVSAPLDVCLTGLNSSSSSSSAVCLLSYVQAPVSLWGTETSVYSSLLLLQCAAQCAWQHTRRCTLAWLRGEPWPPWLLCETVK